MTSNHRELISIGLTILIVAMSLFIIHRFVPSLVWAAIISMSTYPLYQKWQKIFRGWDNVASLLFTMILVFILILPLSWFITILVKEFQFFLNYLHQINSAGGAAPSFIQEL